MQSFTSMNQERSVPHAGLHRLTAQATHQGQSSGERPCPPRGWSWHCPGDSLTGLQWASDTHRTPFPVLFNYITVVLFSALHVTEGHLLKIEHAAYGWAPASSSWSQSQGAAHRWHAGDKASGVKASTSATSALSDALSRSHLKCIRALRVWV